jgi:hypothetical protein
MSTPAEISPRVVVLIYNPIVVAEGGRRLSQVLGWNDPDALTQGYIDDVRMASHGIVNYQVVERIEIDGIPVKRDGFRYDTDSYLRAWRAGSGFHDPDSADYPSMLRDADFAKKVAAGQADELWIFGAPYFGFFESCMGGRGAIWCNGDVVPGASNVPRKFCVMGFSYERGVGEMLENLGHRVENIMEHVFADTVDDPITPWQGGDNLSFWEKLIGKRPAPTQGPTPAPVITPSLTGNLWHAFTRYDHRHGGAASCGNVHFAPSSTRDYEWGNTNSVLTNADDWLNYPNFTGEVKLQNCQAWGHGDIRAHHVWWMLRFPHVVGNTPNGKPHNWWAPIAGLDF